MTDTQSPHTGEQVTLDRSPAQFFFEVGFGACWAEAVAQNGIAAFPLTDQIIERAWAVAGEAHDDPAEFDAYLALTTAARQPEAQGWIVGNGKGDRWRTWAAIGPVWTDDPAKATRYARREDAEAVHAEDEDAWLVVPYPGQPSAPSQDALREALQRIADMWPSSFTDMNAPLGLARAMAAIATAALQQGASKHAE